MVLRWGLLRTVMMVALGVRTCAAVGQEQLSVGFAEADITPDVAARPVWLAGYGMNRRADGVHDPLMARTVVVDDGNSRWALVSVDLVGLQYPIVRQIRARLPDFGYIMVSSTHNHEGPDTIGLWGPTPLHSGVDEDYLALVVDRVVQCVGAARRQAVPVSAAYGTATDEGLVSDSRLPRVLDATLRVLVFHRTDGRRAGILLQWNSHPESLGRRNTLITADFPYATVAALQERYGCPVAYFTGTVGGLLAPPGDRYLDRDPPLREGTFEYAEAHGREVAELAGRAIDSAQPIRLTPLAAAGRPIAVPLDNAWYHAARMLGVIGRGGLVWRGDCDDTSTPLVSAPQARGAVETEVACLRMGDLYMVCVPGEIYPELVYGRYQEPADPGADFPLAPLEPAVVDILPGEKFLLFGLANDEIGYIIPKRQWDRLPPYAYGRATPQYGEVNSCGPDVAPAIMEALRRRVRQLQPIDRP